MSELPSISPPRTPNEQRVIPTLNTSTPNSDDSSIIDDLSFDYVFDGDGNFIRLSKGSSAKSNNSSPSTPNDPHPQLELPEVNPPSPDLLVSPITRVSLSRSESAFPPSTSTTSTTSQEKQLPRSFQRVASGPVATTNINPTSSQPPTASSLAKPRTTAPRRITMEDRNEVQASSRARPTFDPNHYGLQEEKENITETDDYPHQNQVSISQKNRASPTHPTRSVSSSRLASTRSLYPTSTSTGQSSRPLAELPLAQRNSHSRQPLSAPIRPARVVKSASMTKYNNTPAARDTIDRISEGEMSEPSDVPLPGDDTEPEDEPADVDEAAPSASHIPPSRARIPSGLSTNAALSQSGSSRPRRSASLSDALSAYNDDYQMQLQHQYRNPSSRPGTSQGMNNDTTAGARRVPVEPRERHDSEGRSDYKRFRTQTEEGRDDHSPSPTHQQIQPSRTVYGHRRRDSDTLRSMPQGSGLSSPTVMEHNRGSPPMSSRLPGRHSPSSTNSAFRGRVSPPTSKGRLSPPSTKSGLSPPDTKERLSPSMAKDRASPPAASKIAKEVAKHRRSPTAPEPITQGSSLREVSSGSNGKSWNSVERVEEEADLAAEREKEREKEQREQEREKEQREQVERAEREKERERRQQQQQQQAQSAIVAPTPTTVNAPAPPNRHIVVNKKAYARLDLIGKGGSSRVFRVMTTGNEVFAVKRVSLDTTDPDTMNGYINEIKLLKRLEGNNRIIRLIDSEVKASPGGGKGHLLMVMECGEVDFARLLQEQMKEPVNMVWVAYYWQQMLQAVHVIHEEKIVHSDLKPANFVLVRGQLKLIDFGIANAIANDTTNIQRDHQIGTVNYMSPEAIELPEGMRRLKVGRPSDVWSLGCILYQMVYGHPPFQHLSVYQKMKAIPDLTHVIEYAEYAIPRDATTGALDHLRVKVRRDVIMSMKSCLCRTPKERATIPELLTHGWLGSGEDGGMTAEQEKRLQQEIDMEKERLQQQHQLILQQKLDKMKQQMQLQLQQERDRMRQRVMQQRLEESLKNDESVINPYYMRQLLEYGITLGQTQPDVPRTPESLLAEAERLVTELKSLTLT